MVVSLEGMSMDLWIYFMIIMRVTISVKNKRETICLIDGTIVLLIHPYTYWSRVPQVAVSHMEYRSLSMLLLRCHLGWL